MARSPSLLRTRNLHILLPEDLVEEMEARLQEGGRIPFAAKQSLIARLLREEFSGKTLDLSHYFCELPPGSVVRGAKPIMDTLKDALEEQ